MELFAYINEMAVFGVSFLMIALSTIWYSLPLFSTASKRSLDNSVSLQTTTPQRLVVSFGLMFVAYSCILGALSYFSTIAVVLSFPPLFFSYLIGGIALALLLLVKVTEEKPLMYFYKHAGFLCILMLCGSYIMLRWPW